MTMTTTPKGTIETHAHEDDAELEGQIIDLIEKGAGNAIIAKTTRAPLRTILAIRAALGPTAAPPGASPGMLVVGNAASAHTNQPRADRRRCTCGAVQSEHVRGEGSCERTFCRAFELAEEDA